MTNPAREALTRAVNRAIAEGAPVYECQPDANAFAADERRLRDIIRNAAPTRGNEFPHWLPGGWFVLVRASKVILCHSATYDSRPHKSRAILDGPRNGATYAQFAAAMGW